MKRLVMSLLICAGATGVLVWWTAAGPVQVAPDVVPDPPPRAFPVRSVTQQLMPLPNGPIPDGQRVLIVTWDTVRADRTSAYGYPRETTPALAELASRGVRFADFLVPQSTTLPTHVSLFTGTHPEEHGVIGNSAGGEHAFVPPESLPTLAGHLSQQGYLTAGFVSSAPLKKYSGISAGFQTWDEPALRFRSARATTNRALEWLEGLDSDRPWLLWVHTYDPHAPYRVSQDERGQLGEYDHRAVLKEVGATGFDPERMVEWHENYDLEIRRNDDQLQRLLASVEAFPDAVVVVVGDHGEGLGQHGHKEHGLVWPEQLRAPWVLSAPGVEPEVVRAPTTAADLLPTLAAVANLPDEDALLARTSGIDARQAPAGRRILARSSPRQLKDFRKSAHLAELSWSLTSTEHHFEWSPSKSRLFDLEADPHCLQDIASRHPEQIAELTAEVQSRRAALNVVGAELNAGRTRALGAETAEELKALGYLE